MAVLVVSLLAASPGIAQCVNCCSLSTPGGVLLGCCASAMSGGTFCTLTGRNLCMTMFNCQDPVQPPQPQIARYFTLEISAWEATGSGWDMSSFPAVVTADDPSSLRAAIASLGGVPEVQAKLRAFEYSVASTSWAPEGGMAAEGSGYMTRGDVDLEGTGPTRLRVCGFQPDGVPELRADESLTSGQTLLVPVTVSGRPTVVAVHLVEMSEQEWLAEGEERQGAFVDTFEAALEEPAYALIGAGAAGPCE
ncbi:MAG: hypothetical protein Kow0062_28820 [Acidobacteriota bacterium]